MASSSTVEHLPVKEVVVGSSPTLPANAGDPGSDGAHNPVELGSTPRPATTYPRYFKRRLEADVSKRSSLLCQGFEELTLPTEETKVNQQQAEAAFLESTKQSYPESIEEVKNVLSRVRARSNNRRLALKQLHKAHQLTIVNAQRLSEQNDRLINEVWELKEENEKLRTEIGKQLQRLESPAYGVRKSWWSRFFGSANDSETRRIGYLD